MSARGARSRARGPRAGWLRGLSGLLAAGLVVLALGLVGAAVIGGRAGSPGPGAATLVPHLVAAVLAVALQVYADRNGSRRGTLAAVAVLLITAAVLVAGWLV